MSTNVKVNKKTYSGISLIKLPLANGSGYAVFSYDYAEIDNPDSNTFSLGKGSLQVNNTSSAIEIWDSRRVLLPLGVYLAQGKTYNFSLGSVGDEFFYGYQVFKVSRAGLVFEFNENGTTDLNETEIVLKNRIKDSGWLNVDNTYAPTNEYEVVCVNFKKADGSNFTEEEEKRLLNNFTIGEV